MPRWATTRPRWLTARAPNIGIVTAYNDMLSAHQPFEAYPAPDPRRRPPGRGHGAGGRRRAGDVRWRDPGPAGDGAVAVFARCDRAGRRGRAVATTCFDAALYLGVCDKIVPGLIIAAATFGHIPAVFVPAGPMTSGLPNDEKSTVRNAYAEGKASREELMAAEMASYHGPGTCTFYGTANTNQMLMEFMGLHLPGASFRQPRHAPARGPDRRPPSTRAAAITALGNDFRPAGEILDERAYVNGIVGLMATGGSTNLVLHLPAMARASGVHAGPCRISTSSRQAVPLMAKVYPNGLGRCEPFPRRRRPAIPDRPTARCRPVARRRPHRRRRRAGPLPPGAEAGRRRAWPGQRRPHDQPERPHPAPGRRPFRPDRRAAPAVRQPRPRRHQGLGRRARASCDRGPGPHLPQPGRGQRPPSRPARSPPTQSSSCASRARKPTACPNCTR